MKVDFCEKNFFSMLMIFIVFFELLLLDMTEYCLLPSAVNFNYQPKMVLNS